MDRHKNNGYTDKEILNMQQEAVKRVQEMQNKANKNLEATRKHNNYKRPDIGKDKKDKEIKDEKEKKRKNEDEKETNNEKKSIKIPFINKELDKDTIVLLALIFTMVTNECEDKIIIYALIYILIF